MHGTDWKLSNVNEMFAPIGSSLLYLAVLLVWIAFLIQWKLRNFFPKLVDYLGRFQLIAAISLWIAFILLAISFIIKDYSLIVVYNNSNNSMEFGERLMATWASRQGVMVLWSMIMATITVFCYYYFRNQLDEPVVRRMITILFFFNALIALFIMSTRPSPFATQEAFNNGLGLNPSLLSFWQQIHPPVAFLSYSSFIYPFAYSLALLSYNSKDVKVPKNFHWLNDQFMMIGWGTVSLFVVAGSIWGYEENWSGFWAWDPVEVASLIMWAVATLYFHVKSQVSDNHVLRYAVAGLGWVSVAFASFIVRSGILSGLHTYVGGAQLYVFGTLLLGSLAALIYAIAISGEKLLPDYLYSWEKHNAKPKLLTFWMIILLITVNTIGIIMQMINALVLNETEIPYEYYIIFNGILLFSLGILLVLCEINYDNYSTNVLIGLFILISVLSGIILYLNHIDGIFSLTMVSLLYGAFFLLLINMIVTFSKNKNFRKFSIQLVHLLIVLLIITYITVDYNTEVVSKAFNEGEEVSIPEFDITINGSHRIVNNQYIIFISVYSDGELLDNLQLAHGEYLGQFWSSADWITKPGYDLYFHSLATSTKFIISPTTPIEISISRVPLANQFRILFYLFAVIVPLSIYSSLRKKTSNIIKSD